MRWLGQSRRAFDMLCERSLSRYTHGSILADKQMIQEFVAESYAERKAARLLTLQAAWTMDELHAAGKHYSDARLEIGVIKFWGAKVLYNVIDRAIQVHGSLGYTTDLPLESMYRHARAARIYDGPDEVHKVTVARQLLKNYRAHEVPSEHVPTRRAAAIEKFADQLEGISHQRLLARFGPDPGRRCDHDPDQNETSAGPRVGAGDVGDGERGGAGDGLQVLAGEGVGQLGLLAQRVHREAVRVGGAGRRARAR